MGLTAVPGEANVGCDRGGSVPPPPSATSPWLRSPTAQLGATACRRELLLSGTLLKLVHLKTEGRLPTSSYSLVADDREVIGYAQLRHRPSHSEDLPPEAANHAYYEVAEAHRGRGHGKALLRLVLDEARRIGLDRVRLTVDDRNTTSRHVVESAGGALVGEFMSAATGEPCRLFELNLGSRTSRA
jgi:predicted acetyltransferase